MIDLDIAPPAPAAARTGWLVTLVDLISLLLSFFILVYAGSALPRPAWEVTGRSLRLAFGGLADPPPPPRPAIAANPAATGNAASLDHLAAVLAITLGGDPAIASGPAAGAAGRRHGDGDRVFAVDAFDGRLVIAVSRERVFYPRSGKFIEETEGMLTAVVPHLGRLDMPISVAVETGSGGRELAFERGFALLGTLQAHGAAASAPVYVIPDRGDGGKRPRRPCAAAAAVGDGPAVVLCLTGDGR